MKNIKTLSIILLLVLTIATKNANSTSTYPPLDICNYSVILQQADQFRQDGYFEDAKKLYTGIIAQYHANHCATHTQIPTEIYIHSFSGLAYIYKLEGYFESAKKLYTEIIAQYPQIPLEIYLPALLGLGDVYKSESTHNLDGNQMTAFQFYHSVIGHCSNLPLQELASQFRQKIVIFFLTAHMKLGEIYFAMERDEYLQKALNHYKIITNFPNAQQIDPNLYFHCSDQITKIENRALRTQPDTAGMPTEEMDFETTPSPTTKNKKRYPDDDCSSQPQKKDWEAIKNKNNNF